MPVPAGGDTAEPVLLVTAAELASHMQVPEVDTASAEQAIRTASAYVEGKTGMAFSPRTAVVRLPSTRNQYLTLPVRPVTAVNAVTIGDTTYDDFTLTADGTVYRALTWRTAWSPQDVLFTVNYGTTSTPAGIKGPVLEVAAGIYDGRLGVESEQTDDHRISYSGVLSDTSLQILAAYGADVGTLSMTGR